MAEGFQIYEDDPLIGSVAGKAEADDGECAFNLGHVRKKLLGFCADIARVLQRSALRRLYRNHQVALIILGKKSLRNCAVEPERQPQGCGECQEVSIAPP